MYLYPCAAFPKIPVSSADPQEWLKYSHYAAIAALQSRPPTKDKWFASYLAAFDAAYMHEAAEAIIIAAETQQYKWTDHSLKCEFVSSNSNSTFVLDEIPDYPKMLEAVQEAARACYLANMNLEWQPTLHRLLQP